MAKLIRRGLGNRLQGFRIVRFQETPLPLHRRRRLTGTGEIDNRGENAGHTVVLGLLLDDDEAFRQIDKGPPATDKAAVRAFRLFWGTRAELRRCVECFQTPVDVDGNTCQFVAHTRRRRGE